MFIMRHSVEMSLVEMKVWRRDWLDGPLNVGWLASFMIIFGKYVGVDDTYKSAIISIATSLDSIITVVVSFAYTFHHQITAKII